MKKSQSGSLIIIFICWLAYLMSYLGRSDYSVCILDIVVSTGVSRSTAGMVSSSFALCNALGQLACTAIVDRVSPIKIIAAELISVSIINTLFPIMNNFYIMALLWGINGCIQATLLCSITRIFAESLDQVWLTRGTVLLNTIGAVGSVINYLLAPLLISFFNWQIVFFTVACMLFITGVVWCVVMPKLKNKLYLGIQHEIIKEKDIQNIRSNAFAVKSNYIICSILIVFIVGGFRESVSLWIPSYINDMYKYSIEKSTIITVFVPMLQIVGALIAGRIGRLVGNLFVPVLITFAITIVCFVLLIFSIEISVFLSICLFVINAISMTAALTFVLSLYPVRCVSRKNIPKLVGLLNFFVHFGDFFASMGLGALSSLIGWNFTFLVMVSLGFCGMIISFVALKFEDERRCNNVKDNI